MTLDPTKVLAATQAVGALNTGLFGKDSSSSVSSDMETLMNQLTQVSQSTDMSREEKQAATEQLLGQMQSIMQTSSRSLSEQQVAAVEKQLGVITGALNQTLKANYSPEQAAKLSANARNAAIEEVLRQGMGSVIQTETGAGTYESSLRKDAATELSARAATKGSEIELNTQQQFAALEQQRASTLSSSLTGLLDILKGSETTGQQQTSEETGQKSSSDLLLTGSEATDLSATTDVKADTTTSQTQKSETDEKGLLDNLF